MISKAELAKKAKISPMTITRIENGMPCRMETKRKVILALGYEVSDKNRIFSDQANPWHQTFFYKIRSRHHLKLGDDLEGSSAHELVCTPIEYGTSFNQIIWENGPNIATN